MKYAGGLVLVATILAVAATPSLAEYDPKQEETYVKAVVGEAADQGYVGMLAVAEVLRARGWRLRGICASRRKDLDDFVVQQPKRVLREARRAIRAARSGSNTTFGATHFENVKAFGKPRWARRMKVAAVVGDHTFYRRCR